MKNISVKLKVVIFLLVVVCFGVSLNYYFNSYIMSKKINIILMGPAGSGKGTAGDAVKDTYGLLKMSAGDVLREYRKDEKNKYAKTVNEYLNAGKLVPVEIANAIIEDFLDKNIKNYKGVIFDGFPRSEEQAIFLDEYLKKTNQTLDAVVYLKMSPEELVERLKNRYSCAKCGEIYNKVGKKTKKEGVCDVCGHTHFVYREDDADINAIYTRFEIFENETKKVIQEYEARGLVHKIQANSGMEAVKKNLTNLLNDIIENNKK